MTQTTISLLPADCLLHIFSMLPLTDVFSCQTVCKTWMKLLDRKQVWKYVTVSKVHFTDWYEATLSFKEWKTKGITFSDYPVEDGYGFGKTYKMSDLLYNLRRQLRHLHFGILSKDILDFIVNSDREFAKLESLAVDLLTTYEAMAYRSTDEKLRKEYFDIAKLGRLKQLRELKITLDTEDVSYSTFSFSGGLSALGNLKHLRKLCLASLQGNNSYDFSFLSNLTQLVQLQLGDAIVLPPEVYKTLSELHHLRQLSLYNGHCICSSTPCQCEWVDAIGNVTNLIELELDFVHTIPRLNKSLLKLKQLRKLTIVPLKTDVTPNATVFTVKDAQESTIPDVIDGLTWLKDLSWGVHCPWEALQYQNSQRRDITGTLIAVKERIQQFLPNTVILLVPVIKTAYGTDNYIKY